MYCAHCGWMNKFYDDAIKAAQYKRNGREFNKKISYMAFVGVSLFTLVECFVENMQKPKWELHKMQGEFYVYSCRVSFRCSVSTSSL